MAFGTPVAGALAYSAQNGTSVAPAYPASIAANDVLVLVIGMKPSTANGGTVTTPTGWTLRDSITGQGGYATTLGIDTGNTNLYVYTKDTVAGTETGSLTVTVGTNNVCWAAIIRVPGGGSTSERFGTADGGRSAAPTSGVAFTDALTNGATAPNISAGDMVIYAMCVPTDVLAGTGFSAQTISSTGTTFATPVELREASSATGNDIGGYIAYASATAGSSTAAPAIGATATGTTTNIRGPLLLLSIRQTSQTLTQSARFDNTNAFYGPTVTKGAANLAPARYNNTNSFYAATITQTGGSQALTQTARFNNSNVFYSPTASATKNLSPARYNNTNIFYSATVGRGAVTLSPIKLANLNVFYLPTVASGAANLQPARFNNSNTIYSLHITKNAWVINQHTRLDNTNTFYSPSVSRGPVTLSPARYNNSSNFYSLTVTNGSYVINQHVRFDNSNTFYPLNLEEGLFDLHQTNTFTNQNTFFPVSVSGGSISGFKTARRRKGLRPAIPIDWEEIDKLRSLDAKVSLAAIKQTAILNPISATGEVIIDAAIRLSCFNTQHSVADISARSSWNDPTDDELIAIFELIA